MKIVLYHIKNSGVFLTSVLSAFYLHKMVRLSVLLSSIEVDSDFEVCLSIYFFFCVSRYQHQQNNVNPVVKKVYFFWICPDTNAFEWFTDLLQYLEERVSFCFFAIISGNRKVMIACEK